MRAIAGLPVYTTEDNAKLLGQFLTSKAYREERFDDFPLQNCVLVGVDETKERLAFLSPALMPSIRTIDAIVTIVTSSRIWRRGFCERTPIGGQLIGDLDTAATSVRREFASYLASEHGKNAVVVLNLKRSRCDGNRVYVRACNDRYPRIGQFVDSAMLFLGLANSRYQRTAAADVTGIAEQVSNALR
jgi:hypothetical protein